jgi:hypothetical protein
MADIQTPTSSRIQIQSKPVRQRKQVNKTMHHPKPARYLLLPRRKKLTPM